MMLRLFSADITMSVLVSMLDREFICCDVNQVTTSGSMDFSVAVFTHAHFQKIAQISSLCNFPYLCVFGY